MNRPSRTTVADEIRFETPEAYDIRIPQARLDKLAAHVELYDSQTFSSNTLDASPDDCSAYGLPPQKFEALVDRMKNGFNWRNSEQAFLAMGDHLRIRLHNVPGEGDFNMHVVHRRKQKDAIPLCLIHGWPGSFYEFHKIAPLLESDFHIVMPSLPGYAYSDAPTHARGKGDAPWGQRVTAACIDACMRALGYDTYVAQGGDWGSLIARCLAQCYPSRCRAIHLNFVMSGLKGDPPPEQLSEQERRGIARRSEFVNRASGYASIQSTCPYTLGAALSASPLATVAWIAEKCFRWSAPDSQPTLDEVLTFGLIYWTTGKITSSFWLYYNREHHSGDHIEVNLRPVDVPVAVGLGKYELYWPPRSTCEPLFPQLRSFKIFDCGGHFIAHERPDTLRDDMVAFFLANH